MTQGCLFDSAPLPPYRGIGLSREASQDGAVIASGHRQTECDRLQAEYRRAGARGVTDPEMQRRTGLPRHVICARRDELRKAGEVVAAGRRLNPESGVRCVVWVWSGVAREVTPREG